MAKQLLMLVLGIYSLLYGCFARLIAVSVLMDLAFTCAI